MRRWPAIAFASWRSARCRALPAYQQCAAPGRRKARGSEIAWPFPRDGWPAGAPFAAAWPRAAARSRSMCGRRSASAIATRGVADDDEVDRVADLDLMSEHFAPLAPGDVVRFADMPGRIAGL